MSDLKKIELFDWKLDSLSNLISYFAGIWNSGEIPRAPGTQTDINLTPFAPAKVMVGSAHEDAHIYAIYEVISEFYFGVIPFINARGFWDLQKEALVFPSNSELITTWLDRTNMPRDWKKIGGIQAAPKPPLVIFKGISYYNMNDPGIDNLGNKIG